MVDPGDRGNHLAINPADGLTSVMRHGIVLKGGKCSEAGGLCGMRTGRGESTRRGGESSDSWGAFQRERAKSPTPAEIQTALSNRVPTELFGKLIVGGKPLGRRQPSARGRESCGTAGGPGHSRASSAKDGGRPGGKG